MINKKTKDVNTIDEVDVAFQKSIIISLNPYLIASLLGRVRMLAGEEVQQKMTYHFSTVRLKTQNNYVPN